jgi:hypothetical protein
LTSVRGGRLHSLEAGAGLNEPRQIYVGSLTRREASWGRARRRWVPAWILAAVVALALLGALLGPVVLPALA